MPSTDSDPIPNRATETALIERLKKLPEWANRDEGLVHRGRFVTLDFQVVVGTRPCFISVVQGKVENVEFSQQRMCSSTFIIGASAAAWERFWQPMPEPWWHDLFAMNKKGNVTIEGNLHPFMANLQYFKDLLALPRRVGGAR